MDGGMGTDTRRGSQRDRRQDAADNGDDKMTEQTCEHNTAIVLHSRKDHTHMLCTWSCQQPFVMQKQSDGTYRRRDDVVAFYLEREASVVDG